MRRGVPPFAVRACTSELGYDKDGCRRFLKAPFPLSLDMIESEFAGLSATDLGRALKLAAHWWFWGTLPHQTGLCKLLGLQGAKARAVLDANAHRFTPTSTLGMLRANEIAKARRRLKLGTKPTPEGVVLRFPGSGSRV